VILKTGDFDRNKTGAKQSGDTFSLAKEIFGYFGPMSRFLSFFYNTSKENLITAAVIHKRLNLQQKQNTRER
jgi:hypothetical protein